MRVVLGAIVLAAGCGFHGQAGGDGGSVVGDDGARGGDAAIADAAGSGSGSGSGPDAGIDARVWLDAPPDAPPTPPAFTGDWAIPCTLHPPGQDYCNAVDTSSNVHLDGVGTEHWHATVRIRGVMANNVYQNGSGLASTGWYAGGSAVASKYERFSVTVSSPAGTYFLNAGTPTTCCTNVFDYMAEFDVDGGATLTFDAKSGDGFLWENMGNLTVTGVATTPDPYDGQFAHLDLIAITPI